MPAGFWEREVYRLKAEMAELRANARFDPTKLSNGELILCLDEMRRRYVAENAHGEEL